MRNGPPKKPLIILISLGLAALVVLSVPLIGEERAQASPNDLLICTADAAGNQGNGDCASNVAMSSDGRYCVFSDNATILGATGQQIYRKDLKSGAIRLCSANASGGPGNNSSYYPSISADGRFVTFSSNSSNLLGAATAGIQVFRKDLISGEVLLVSASKAGVQGNNSSYGTSISADGNYVAFDSLATNLVSQAISNQQVYWKDISLGDVILCSQTPSGTEGNDYSNDAAISADGRYVSFFSKATNLMSGGNSSQQVFRADITTGEVKMCSADAAGAQGNNASVDPSMSRDGRYVVFGSRATNLVPGLSGAINQVLRKDLQTGVVALCSSLTGVPANGESRGPAVSGDGRYVSFSSWSTNLVPAANGLNNVFRWDSWTGEVSLCSIDKTGTVGNSNSTMPCITPDGRYTAFLSSATNLIPGGNAHWQVFRKELSAATTFYFAEGYTGNNFQEYLCLGTTSGTASAVHITYMFPNGATQDQLVTVPGFSRITINVNSVVGAGKEVSARLEGDAPFAAERPMYFKYQNKWTGGHDVVGASMPATQWSFAEGYTGPGFDEWVCVLNPGDQTAHLDFLFTTQEQGPMLDQGHSVLPHSRGSFSVNQLLGGKSYQTGLVLSSDNPIVAERPIYFNYGGTSGSLHWQGGHCAMGRPYLSSQYYLAEGTTRHGFEEWLTLQNPNPLPLVVQASYQLGSGQGGPVNKTYTIDPFTRMTKFIPDEVGYEKDVSIYLVSSGPFLAERPMYFNYQGMGAHNWQGGHCVMGTPSTDIVWFFAEGYTGNNFEEWLCVQNPGAGDAQVQFTYLTQEAGALPFKIETIPAHSRQTFLVNTHAGPGYQLSAAVSVLAGDEVVVERPMYFDYNGWDGGHDVMGYVPAGI